MTWKTIDSAPKDGTVIDLWVIDNNRRESRYANCWYRLGVWEYTDGFTEEVYGDATHWMPLPPPPDK